MSTVTGRPVARSPRCAWRGLIGLHVVRPAIRQLRQKIARAVFVPVHRALNSPLLPIAATGVACPKASQDGSRPIAEILGLGVTHSPLTWLAMKNGWPGFRACAEQPTAATGCPRRGKLAPADATGVGRNTKPAGPHRARRW